ncbi:unnamed protein product, partial [Medioppia subpectinata]
YFWKTKGRNETLEEYIICRNSEWYSDKNIIDFMSKIGRYLRVTTMMGKTIRDRLDTTGLCFSEFSYQMFQSYDWLYLYQKYGAEFQIGGIDQTVNIHNGHDLIRRLTDKQTFGLFMPILTDENGKKFGKSEEKAIYLNDDKISPFGFYQFFHQLTDRQVYDFLKMFSFRSDAEIEQIYQKSLRTQKPWYLQEIVAEEMTLLVHGEAGLSSAKRTTDALFKRDVEVLARLNESEINDVFEGAPMSTLIFNPDEMTAIELAIKAQCFTNEFLSPQQILTQTDILANSITLVSVGKRKHHIVKWY